MNDIDAQVRSGKVVLNAAQIAISAARIARLKAGNHQFGHEGEHRGNGTKDCPRRPHHHCDEFCQQPTDLELLEAGIDPGTFRSVSRR
jgi:hypothetical protein